jgi:hypothetical protein
MTRAEAIVDRFDEGAKQNIHKASACQTIFSHATITIRNMYTYHCHNTKHMHVPLSQYNTRRLPLSQYKTCPRNVVTVQI